MVTCVFLDWIRVKKGKVKINAISVFFIKIRLVSDI